MVNKANRFRLIIPTAEATTQPPIAVTPPPCQLTTTTHDDRSGGLKNKLVSIGQVIVIQAVLHWVELRFGRLGIKKRDRSCSRLQVKYSIMAAYKQSLN